MDELGSLFRQALNYGEVSIFTHKDDTYSCSIDFRTIANTSLKASSGYKSKTPEDAVKAAIANAKTILDSFAKIKKVTDGAS